jgi:glutathionyl-hydroquinone reductase
MVSSQQANFNSIQTLINLLLQSELVKQRDSGILNWADKSGEFKRQVSSFRDFISAKPDAKYPPEKGRYKLYVSYACPWGTFLMAVQNCENGN